MALAETRRKRRRVQAAPSPSRRRVPALLTQAAQSQVGTAKITAAQSQIGTARIGAQPIGLSPVKELQRPGGCADCPPAIGRDITTACARSSQQL